MVATGKYTGLLGTMLTASKFFYGTHVDFYAVLLLTNFFTFWKFPKIDIFGNAAITQ